MNRQIICCVCLFVSLFLFSCSRKEVPAETEPAVYLADVKSASRHGTVTFVGKTKASSEVNLSFRVPGRIEKVLVEEGDFVEKGEVVALMDKRDYAVQLAAAKAEYEQVKVDAERVMALYAEGNVTASNYDKARYGLKQVSQKLANCENRLADTQLRSSVAGYVQTKFHESGETVSEGMPIVSVFERENLEVEIKMSSSDFVDIKRFTDFYCSFESMKGRDFPLRIERVSQEANSSQLYMVRLKFADEFDCNKITPGMTTIVHAQVSEDGGSAGVIIPSSAVLHSEDKNVVFVYLAETGIIRSRDVHVAAVNRDGTMLVDSGLNPGEKIVSSGVHHVTDGQKVKVLKKSTPSNVGGLL